MFEGDFGDPRTEPAPTVTPSSVGGSILPFRCPHCGGVAPALACPVDRRKFQDPRPGRRDRYWCPLCRGRLRLDLRGTPLSSPLAAGATSAPARVDWGGGRIEVVGHVPLWRRWFRPAVGLDVLGAVEVVGIYRNTWR